MKIFLIFNIIRYALCINITYVSPSPILTPTNINKLHASCTFSPSPSSISSKLQTSYTFLPSPSSISSKLQTLYTFSPSSTSSKLHPSSSSPKLHASYTFSPSPYPTPKQYNIPNVIPGPIIKKEVSNSDLAKSETKIIEVPKNKRKISIILISGIFLILFFIIYLSIKIIFFRNTFYKKIKKNDDRLPIYSPKSTSQNNSPNGFTPFGFSPNHEMKLYRRNNSNTNLLSTNIDDKI
jgi:hypothetical protein